MSPAIACGAVPGAPVRPHRLEALARVRRVQDWAHDLAGAAVLIDALSCLVRGAGLAAEYARCDEPVLRPGDAERAAGLLRTWGPHLAEPADTARVLLATGALSVALAEIDRRAPQRADDPRQLQLHADRVLTSPGAGESEGAR